LLEKYRRLEAEVKARGQVRLDDLSAALGARRDLLRTWMCDLTWRQRFSGYVNWDDGVVYWLQAGQLDDWSHCPHCGAQVDLTGRGVIRCGRCAVEVFLPKEVPRQPDHERMVAHDSLDFEGGQRSTQLTGEPGPGTENRFQRLWELFKPSPRAIVVLWVGALTFSLALLLSLAAFFSESPGSLVETGLTLLGFVLLPGVALFTTFSALLERRNPPRTLLWAELALAVGFTGTTLAALMSIDPSAGFETSLLAVLLLLTPLLLVFSIPPIYFGVKSWQEVLKVLGWQLGERAMKLIQSKGEVDFYELAVTLAIPLEAAADLVDGLLRSGRLQGTIIPGTQRVYTAGALTDKRKRLLGYLASQEKVSLQALGAHLRAPLYLLRELVYQVVQLGQFNGYINWEQGYLRVVSKHDLAVDGLCPHCGGNLTSPAGELDRCRGCGVEISLA
jgi:hypothetical protein